MHRRVQLTATSLMWPAVPVSGIMVFLMLAHAVGLLTLLTRFSAMVLPLNTATCAGEVWLSLFEIRVPWVYSTVSLSGDDFVIGSGSEELWPLQDAVRRAVPSMWANVVC